MTLAAASLYNRARLGGHLRREQDVIEAEQRAVGRGRLRVEPVDGGAGDRPASDRGRERGGVQDFAAAGIVPRNRDSVS